MGGWTRIWVVLTVVVGALAGWMYVEDVQYGERQANNAYKDALDGYDNCRQTPAAPQGPPDAFSQFLKDACDYAAQPRVRYAKQQAQQRDHATARAKRDAASRAFSTVSWVSGTVGALFLAIG
ncbi:hypothetical protein [Trinickia fusca]|uniref:hypothetical protein n=1 Tax=Trinickia fusca TaxID=2419777 RepID=UPI0011C42BA0|nr:hypothetical protein [Trinickia fusca]